MRPCSLEACVDWAPTSIYRDAHVAEEERKVDGLEAVEVWQDAHVREADLLAAERTRGHVPYGLAVFFQRGDALERLLRLPA